MLLYNVLSVYTFCSNILIQPEHFNWTEMFLVSNSIINNLKIVTFSNTLTNFQISLVGDFYNLTYIEHIDPLITGDISFACGSFFCYVISLMHEQVFATPLEKIYSVSIDYCIYKLNQYLFSFIVEKFNLDISSMEDFQSFTGEEFNSKFHWTHRPDCPSKGKVERFLLPMHIHALDTGVETYCGPAIIVLKTTVISGIETTELMSASMYLNDSPFSVSTSRVPAAMPANFSIYAFSLSLQASLRRSTHDARGIIYANTHISRDQLPTNEQSALLIGKFDAP